MHTTGPGPGRSRRAATRDQRGGLDEHEQSPVGRGGGRRSLKIAGSMEGALGPARGSSGRVAGARRTRQRREVRQEAGTPPDHSAPPLGPCQRGAPRGHAPHRCGLAIPAGRGRRRSSPRHSRLSSSHAVKIPVRCFDPTVALRLLAGLAPPARRGTRHRRGGRDIQQRPAGLQGSIFAVVRCHPRPRRLLGRGAGLVRRMGPAAGLGLVRSALTPSGEPVRAGFCS